MMTFEFVKQNGVWCFHHPEYARRNGGKDTNTVVYKEGLHTLLEAVGKDCGRVRIEASDRPFPNCDELELTRAEADGKGGFYLLKSLRQKPYVLLIRFFDVHSFFGYLPSRLYLLADALA